MLGSLEKERVLESENNDAPVFRASSHLQGNPIYKHI